MYIRISILIILLLINIALFVRMVWGPTGLLEYYALKEKYQTLQNQIDDIDTSNVTLSNEIRLLQADNHYVEQVVRQHLHYIKNNELLYLFDNKNPQSLGAEGNVRKN